MAKLDSSSDSKSKNSSGSSSSSKTSSSTSDRSTSKNSSSLSSSSSKTSSSGYSGSKNTGGGGSSLSSSSSSSSSKISKSSSSGGGTKNTGGSSLTSGGSSSSSSSKLNRSSGSGGGTKNTSSLSSSGGSSSSSSSKIERSSGSLGGGQKNSVPLSALAAFDRAMDSKTLPRAQARTSTPVPDTFPSWAQFDDYVNETDAFRGPGYTPVPDTFPSWEQFDDYIRETGAFGPRMTPVPIEFPSWAQFDDYVNDEAFGPRGKPEETATPAPPPPIDWSKLDDLPVGPDERGTLRNVPPEGKAEYTEGPLELLKKLFGDMTIEAGKKRMDEREAAGGPRTGLDAFIWDLSQPGKKRMDEREAAGGPRTGLDAFLWDMGLLPGYTPPVPAPSADTPRVIREAALGPDERGVLPNKAPRVDPESGFIQDPETGTFYRPDLLPKEGGRLVTPQPGTDPEGKPFQWLFDGLNALDNLKAGIEGEQRRLAGPPLPRPRPAGIDGALPRLDLPPTEYAPEDALFLPGQVEGALPAGKPYAGPQTAPEPKRNIWGDIVDGAGKVLENTTLGGIVKGLFPDVWYGAGEAMKGLGIGTSGRNDWPPDFTQSASGGSLIEQEKTYPVTPTNSDDDDDDDNGGGGGGGEEPPITDGKFVYDRWGRVVFPLLPPYNPGVDAEWLYFRRPAEKDDKQGLWPVEYAQGFAEGGPVSSPTAQQDPRLVIIADAEDAIENMLGGEAAEEDDAPAIEKFIETFGEEALAELQKNVAAGMKMRKRSRLVRGEGGPTDDAIPARIDEVEEARLSDGEFVMTADAVQEAGDGDPLLGAQRLQELNDRLAGIAPKRTVDVEKVG